MYRLIGIAGMYRIVGIDMCRLLKSRCDDTYRFIGITMVHLVVIELIDQFHQLFFIVSIFLDRAVKS